MGRKKKKNKKGATVLAALATLAKIFISVSAWPLYKISILRGGPGASSWVVL